MSNRLREKVAVVSNASKGLGAAIALRFGTEGASVVVNYSGSKDAADKVVDDICIAGGKAIAVKANMSDPGDVGQLFAEAGRVYGRVDVLINNAGIYDFRSIEKLSREDFRKHFDLNVFGYFLAIREAIRYMPEGGSIVNLSCTDTIFVPENASVYMTGKGTVDGLTRALSNELAPLGIRVNAIKPGVIDTEGVETGGFLQTDIGQEIIARTPLRRIGVPDDVVPAAVYLASDESSWTRGEFIFVAGGRH
ncbi:SDR family NAD(P)-dependent oxidoreductase [Burkholderia vietnamiensis]|uniref:SDR family NAD(P)-dependent oxidoreductase n=1 Tax=Burkholderia vietnamiensis TaxID=60552 RepID=UPI0015942EE9|nr:SDR family oxidoreductase [Burkholderia vietnamiensis]